MKKNLLLVLVFISIFGFSQVDNGKYKLLETFDAAKSSKYGVAGMRSMTLTKSEDFLITNGSSLIFWDLYMSKSKGFLNINNDVYPNILKFSPNFDNIAFFSKEERKVKKYYKDGGYYYVDAFYLEIRRYPEINDTFCKINLGTYEDAINFNFNNKGDNVIINSLKGDIRIVDLITKKISEFKNIFSIPIDNDQSNMGAVYSKDDKNIYVFGGSYKKGMSETNTDQSAIKLINSNSFKIIKKLKISEEIKSMDINYELNKIVIGTIINKISKIGKIYIINSNNLSIDKEIELNFGINNVHFNKKGNLIITSNSDESFSVWDTSSGKLIQNIKINENNVKTEQKSDVFFGDLLATDYAVFDAIFSNKNDSIIYTISQDGLVRTYLKE